MKKKISAVLAARQVALIWAVLGATLCIVDMVRGEGGLTLYALICVGISSLYEAAAFIVDAIERKK